jgi:hypothetical protein
VSDRSFINLAFTSRPRGEAIDFAHFGHDVFKSEELTDLVYQVWLTLLADGYGGREGCLDYGMADAAYLMTEGVYLPCVKRTAYTRFVDRRNDGLPDHAAVFLLSAPVGDGTVDPPEPWPEPVIIQTRRVAHFPRRVCSLVPGDKYKWMHWERQKPSNRHDRRWPGRGTVTQDTLIGTDGYFTVSDDDRVVHARYEFAFGPEWAAHYAKNEAWPALALNAWADRRFLWQVRTKERLLKHTETPLILGVDESHVKSLFYARSLPVTESGRKRPILHWVRAHERRVASGIDVDVRKHLRGITEFDMDCLHFQIISPDKQAEREAA